MTRTEQTVTLAQAIQIALELQQAGRIPEAEALGRQVLQAYPEQPGALYLLGIIAQQKGDTDAAIDLLERAIAANPAASDFHNQIGMAYRQQGNLSRAEQHFREALALEAGFAEAHNNIGNLLRMRGDMAGAIACYRQALQYKADFAEAHNNLGVACLEADDPDAAASCWERALALQPGFADAHNNLGNVLKARGELAAAAEHYQRTIALKPGHAEAHNNLGVALMEHGLIEEATGWLRRALELDPGYSRAYSNLLLCGQYAELQKPEENYAAHCGYARLFETPLQAVRKAHANSPDPERRLKIGYVSADFRQHSVAYFIEPVFAHHDKSCFEVYCYYSQRRRDAVTTRLEGYADHWLDCAAWPDEELEQRIRDDGIDILVDLAGHTAGNRLPLFARKPAPVQVTYLGYPDTTGLAAMDYRLTDEHADPKGAADRFHAEKLLRLPDTFLCYRPFGQAPEVAALPFDRTGQVTFGSFNSLAKVPPMIGVWARILLALPEARLVIKAGNLQGGDEIRQRILAQFAAQGVAAERLVLPGREPSTGQHLAWYGEVDIALDSYPYNGTTTTCEALWMGVPVVTLSGERHVSMVGASLLQNAGLPELIARHADEYADIALNLACAPERLRLLRQNLRQRMLASPLLDEKRFTANLENTYRQMWREWCPALGG